MGKERDAKRRGEEALEDFKEFRPWHFLLTRVYGFLTSIIKSSYTINGIEIVITL